jgi:hypothetical protein
VIKYRITQLRVVGEMRILKWLGRNLHQVLHTKVLWISDSLWYHGIDMMKPRDATFCMNDLSLPWLFLLYLLHTSGLGAGVAHLQQKGLSGASGWGWANSTKWPQGQNKKREKIQHSPLIDFNGGNIMVMNAIEHSKWNLVFSLNFLVRCFCFSDTLVRLFS